MTADAADIALLAELLKLEAALKSAPGTGKPESEFRSSHVVMRTEIAKWPEVEILERRVQGFVEALYYPKNAQGYCGQAWHEMTILLCRHADGRVTAEMGVGRDREVAHACTTLDDDLRDAFFPDWRARYANTA